MNFFEKILERIKGLLKPKTTQETEKVGFCFFCGKGLTPRQKNTCHVCDGIYCDYHAEHDKHEPSKKQIRRQTGKSTTTRTPVICKYCKKQLSDFDQTVCKECGGVFCTEHWGHEVHAEGKPGTMPYGTCKECGKKLIHVFDKQACPLCRKTLCSEHYRKHTCDPKKKSKKIGIPSKIYHPSKVEIYDNTRRVEMDE